MGFVAQTEPQVAALAALVGHLDAADGSHVLLIGDVSRTLLELDAVAVARAHIGHLERMSVQLHRLRRAVRLRPPCGLGRQIDLRRGVLGGGRRAGRLPHRDAARFGSRAGHFDLGRTRGARVRIDLEGDGPGRRIVEPAHPCGGAARLGRSLRLRVEHLVVDREASARRLDGERRGGQDLEYGLARSHGLGGEGRRLAAHLELARTHAGVDRIARVGLEPREPRRDRALARRRGSAHLLGRLVVGRRADELHGQVVERRSAPHHAARHRRGRGRNVAHRRAVEPESLHRRVLVVAGAEGRSERPHHHRYKKPFHKSFSVISFIHRFSLLAPLALRPGPTPCVSNPSRSSRVRR